MMAVVHYEKQGDRKSLASQICLETVMNTDKTTDAVKFDFVKLPIDRDMIHSHRLLQMIELIETLRTMDGQRTLWQVLVDAGADVDHIFYRDIEQDADEDSFPALQFRVQTSKLKGFLVIEDDFVQRGFRLSIQMENCPLRRMIDPCVFLRDLVTTIVRIIDDGSRRWNHSHISQLVRD